MMKSKLSHIYRTPVTYEMYRHYYYIYQQQHSTGYIESTYTHDQFPANLEKKRYILQQFKYYNATNLDVDYGTPKASYPTGTHVLKYAVDKNAISFKLSNGVVQVDITGVGYLYT